MRQKGSFHPITVARRPVERIHMNNAWRGRIKTSGGGEVIIACTPLPNIHRRPYCHTDVVLAAGLAPGCS